MALYRENSCFIAQMTAKKFTKKDSVNDLSLQNYPKLLQFNICHDSTLFSMLTNFQPSFQNNSEIKKKNYIILEKFVESDSGIFPGFKKNL